MAHYVMLTKLSPEAAGRTRDLEQLEREVKQRLETECPEVRWVTSYSVLGPYDYVDVFEAPDNVAATKVALIVRSFGHATTETWPAMPWTSFRDIARMGAILR
jgi:uncharacterized protein with GYD domain